MPYRNTLGAAVIAAALACAACSKGEPQQAKKSASAPAPAAAPQAPEKSAGEIDAALKDRLARQEAAAKMFDRPTPAAPTPAPSPAPSPAPAMPQAASPVPEPRKVEPPRAPEPAKPASAPAAAPAKAEPAKAEPPPRVDLAAARPSAIPAPTAPRVVSRVEPDFPRNAPDNGVVRARITMDAAGTVTRVDVLEAQPRRVFDRAVVSALSQWRFNEGAGDRTFDTEVVFRR